MKVADLKPNQQNPRKITEQRLSFLKKTLKEFGDLGGLVFNRKTKHLIGGHQRLKLFDKTSEVKIEKKYEKPSRTGTIAEGYVILHGERFRYREVSWDEAKEKAATIAANKSAGDWNNSILSSWLVNIKEFGLDLDLTMFSELERKKIMPNLSLVSAHERDKNKKKDKEEPKEHICPNCNFEFNDATPPKIKLKKK